MKKLMFSAVALASAAAMADICDPTQQSVNRTCEAYVFQASVKTVEGKTSTYKDKDTVCVGGDKHTTYYRVKASKKFKGVFTVCNPCLSWTQNPDGQWSYNGKTSDSFLTGEALGGARMYMSTSDSKNSAVYTTEVSLGNIADSYKFWIQNIIGGPSESKSKVVEAFWGINFVEQDKFGEFRNYALFLAGFGTRSGDGFKNLSGNLAGAVTAANWCGKPTLCWEPCLLTPYYTDLVIAQDGTFTYTPIDWQGLEPKSPQYDAVSGTWSLKYNSSYSKLSTSDALMKKVFGSKNYFIDLGGAQPTFPIDVMTINLN